MEDPKYSENIRPFGRPSKYNKDYCQQLIDYFSVKVVERIEDRTAGGGTHTHFEVERVPSIQGFAAQIGVHVDTLYEWAQTKFPEGHKRAGKLRHPEFSDAFTRAQSIEAKIMFEYGIAGHLNPALTAMYWTNKLNYKDSKHLDMTSDGERIQTAPAVISVIATRQTDAQAGPEAS